MEKGGGGGGMCRGSQVASGVRPYLLCIVCWTARRLAKACMSTSPVSHMLHPTT